MPDCDSESMNQAMDHPVTEARSLLDLVHTQLKQLRLHSASRIKTMQQRQDGDPFVTITDEDEHNLQVDQHLQQLNGNIDAIDQILDNLTDENSHLHARLTALRVGLDVATTKLHNFRREGQQQSVKHWEELSLHLNSCHIEMTLTKEVLLQKMRDKQLRLMIEYIKNEEYDCAVNECRTLEGDFRQHLSTVLDEVYAGDTKGALQVILFLNRFFDESDYGLFVEGFRLLVEQLSKNDQLCHPVALIVYGMTYNFRSDQQVKNILCDLKHSVEFLGSAIRDSRTDQFSDEICSHLSLNTLDVLMEEAYQEDVRPICEFIGKLPAVSQRIQCYVKLNQQLESNRHLSENGILILVEAIKTTMDLPGFRSAANAEELIELKNRLPRPIVDIFWHDVRIRFGTYYMEAKTGLVPMSLPHRLEWDYLSSSAGRHEFIPYCNGAEFEIRNVSLQQYLVEKDRHIRWYPNEGDRWRLIPNINEEDEQLRFRIRNQRTGNCICSCMAHTFGSMEVETENVIAVKFRCIDVDADENEGNFNAEISRFELERESSECCVM